MQKPQSQLLYLSFHLLQCLLKPQVWLQARRRTWHHPWRKPQPWMLPHFEGCFRAYPNGKPNPPLLKLPRKLEVFCLDGSLCCTHGGDSTSRVKVTLTVACHTCLFTFKPLAEDRHCIWECVKGSTPGSLVTPKLRLRAKGPSNLSVDRSGMGLTFQAPLHLAGRILYCRNFLGPVMGYPMEDWHSLHLQKSFHPTREP